MLQRLSPGSASTGDSALYEGQQQVLAQLVAGMDEQTRWLLLTGPDGSGKSVILQALRAELRSTTADVVIIDGREAADAEDLMMALRGQLLLAPARGKLLRNRARARTIVASRRDRTSSLVVMVDNAHGLSFRSLKLLAALVRKTSAEAGGAWVVLAGRPSLTARALRAGRKLQVAESSPPPLTPAEILRHIDRRMRGGTDRTREIPAEAVDAIARYTQGLPGRIDALCDLVVRKPSVRLSREVTVEAVKEAATQLGFDPSSRATPRALREEPDGERPARDGHWLPRVAAALLIFVVTVALGALGWTHGIPLAREGYDWVVAQVVPPEPPARATPPATAAPKREARRERATVAAATAPTASGRMGATAATASGRTGAAEAPASSRTVVTAPTASGRTGAEPSASDRPTVTTKGELPRPLPNLVSASQVAALIEGARTGRSDDVQKLLASGVSPNVRDAAGVAPIMHAVQQGHLDATRALLDKGAQIDVRDRGGITPTMMAVINDRSDVLQLLLQRGADVNARSGSGWTALTWAAWKGDPDLVRTLLRHGARRDIADKQGWTPLDYAVAHASSAPADPDASSALAQPPEGSRHSAVVPLLQRP